MSATVSGMFTIPPISVSQIPAVAEAHMYDTLSSFERLFFHVATA